MERESYSVEAGWHRYWNRHITELTTTTDQMMVEDPRIAVLSEEFLGDVTQCYQPHEVEAVSLALRLATKHHHAVTRKEEKDSSGNPLPYLSHPIDVATQLLYLEEEIGEKPPYYALMTALFHDGPEDSTIEATGTAEKSWKDYLTGLFQNGLNLPEGDVRTFIHSLALLQKDAKKTPLVDAIEHGHDSASQWFISLFPKGAFTRYPQMNKLARHSREFGMMIARMFSQNNEIDGIVFDPKWPMLIKAIDTKVNIWGKMTIPKIFRAAYMAAVAEYFGAVRLSQEILSPLDEQCITQGIPPEVMKMFVDNMLPTDISQGMSKKERRSRIFRTLKLQVGRFLRKTSLQVLDHYVVEPFAQKNFDHEGIKG